MTERMKDDDQEKLYYELLEEIQEVDFVLVELNLYLNTHPHDHKAINQFNEYVKHSMTLKNKFQSLFGPLQNMGGSFSTYPWTWSESPWPWQV